MDESFSCIGQNRLIISESSPYVAPLMVESKGKSQIADLFFCTWDGILREREPPRSLETSPIYLWPLDHERRTALLPSRPIMMTKEQPFSDMGKMVVNMRKNLGQNEARGNKHHVDAVLPTT
mmetsp:Transcript_37448/g.68798  ORF Transcript_37448/g.68798 Transcript_37448/m.68798 type:complete len:122 (+) Transcript_37448:334-699(+)